MRYTTLSRWIGGIILILVLILIGSWLAFVPGAQEPPYRFISAWGEQGDGPGQFNDPIGIAVADEEVFVADSRNGRIQVFDRDGRFKRQFGSPGDRPGDKSDQKLTRNPARTM